MVEVKSKEKLLDFAMDVLREEEDFFGIVDPQETTLQFYVEESGDLWVEIPAPEEQGSYGKIITMSELLTIMKVLDVPFSKDMITGMAFVAW